MAADSGHMAFVGLGGGQVNHGHSGPIRSYDHQGVVFSWEPPAGVDFRRAAIDVEAIEAPSVRYMSVRYALPESTFLGRWTATEVIAKVLDLPVLELLKQNGLAEEASSEWSRCSQGVWMRALPHPTHSITVGLLL